MKILQLCLRSPFPPADGGTIAMFNMAMALHKAGAEVKVVAFNTKKHFVDPASIPEQFTSAFQPEMVYLDATVRVLPAFWNLVSGDSYNVSRFDSPLFHRTLGQLLEREKFDIVQMESLFMTPYLGTIRKNSDARVILRAHNVEYLIWNRLADATDQPFKKWYLNFLSNRLKKYEAAILNKLDGIIALTEEDKHLFRDIGCKKPVLVCPIGLDTENYPVNTHSNGSLSIVHLGSMDWLPNIEGVDWFLNRVYPLLKNKLPGTSVFLAGKNMPERIFNLAGDGLHVDGRIDDAKKYLSGKQIMIVPLLSGGGMRVKIIEGMAMGKTIISTTVGAEGIRYENNKNLLIADTPEAFCDAIVNCSQNASFTHEIGRQARLLAEQVYENNVIGSEVIKFYNSLSGPASNQ